MKDAVLFGFWFVHATGKNLGPRKLCKHLGPGNSNRRSFTSSTAQGGGGSFKNRKPIGAVGCCETRMAERSHWWTERCLRSPLFLSLSLTIDLPTYLSIYLSTYLSIYPSIHPSIYLSIHPSIHPSLCLSVCLSACLSVYLPVYLQAWKRSFCAWQHQKHRNSARLPECLNLTTSKTKQFCETSSFFKVDNIENEAILRDFLNISTWQLQKWREHVVFCTFWLRNVLRATTACTFSTSQLPKVGAGVFCTFWLRNVLRATTTWTFSTAQLLKVLRSWGVLYILTSKCASRHNDVDFFNSTTPKSAPKLRCFVHFDLEMCFAPHWRAIFHLSSG